MPSVIPSFHPRHMSPIMISAPIPMSSHTRDKYKKIRNESLMKKKQYGSSSNEGRYWELDTYRYPLVTLSTSTNAQTIQVNCRNCHILYFQAYSKTSEFCGLDCKSSYEYCKMTQQLVDEHYHTLKEDNSCHSTVVSSNELL